MKGRWFMSSSSRQCQAGTSKHQGKADSGAPDKAGHSAGGPTKQVRFQITADSGSKVYVAGTFNNWDPKQQKLTEKKGVYSASVLLPVGRHEYKFIINDVWIADPKCQEWVPNEHGSLNSVLTVG
jgi:1,4-alpha-glucan branching enzyme